MKAVKRQLLMLVAVPLPAGIMNITLVFQNQGITGSNAPEQANTKTYTIDNNTTLDTSNCRVTFYEANGTSINVTGLSYSGQFDNSFTKLKLPLI